MIVQLNQMVKTLNASLQEQLRLGNKVMQHSALDCAFVSSYIVSLQDSAVSAQNILTAQATLIWPECNREDMQALALKPESR